MDRQVRRDMLAGLYARQYPELVRLAFALTGDWALAEDLAQEAFVRAWSSWDRLRQAHRAEAYLRAIVVNLARSSFRRQVRDIRARAVGPPAAWVVPPGEVHSDAGIDLLRALGRLPAGKRACVVLRFYLDLSETDTAALLGVSVGTVKSQTAKALRMLRTWLAEDDTAGGCSPAAWEAVDGN